MWPILRINFIYSHGQKKSVESGVEKSHSEFVANVRNYSSGPSFQQISDDNTSGMFTNYIGFVRPQHVEVGSTALSIPSEDTTVLKRNHTIMNTFTF